MKKTLNIIYISAIIVMVGRFVFTTYLEGHFRQIFQIWPMSHSVKEALVAPAISFIFIILPLLLLFFAIPRKLKKEAESRYSNFRKIIGASGWSSLTQFSQKYKNSVSISGTYNGRKIICTYVKSTDIGIKSLDHGNKGFFEIMSKPHTVPKKLPWYKFKHTNVLLNNECFLLGDTVIFITVEEDLSIERCNQILENLKNACETVERGEYNLN